jgi:hypothetical protein
MPFAVPNNLVKRDDFVQPASPFNLTQSDEPRGHSNSVEFRPSERALVVRLRVLLFDDALSPDLAVSRYSCGDSRTATLFDIFELG